MKLYNLKDHNEQVSFTQAVKQGLGSQQGLFFPHELPEIESTVIEEWLSLDPVLAQRQRASSTNAGARRRVGLTFA